MRLCLSAPLLVFVLFLQPFLGSAQVDQEQASKPVRNKYGIALIPSAANNIYGIALGPIGSEAVCNPAHTKHSHGLNLQILGQGFFQIFYTGKKFALEEPGAGADTARIRAIHNGLLISPLGTFTDQVNGLSISSWMSMGRAVNGISANLLWNKYQKINGLSLGAVNHAGVLHGVQLGLVNKASRSKGVQFGLWNRNEKRGSPLLNWNFRYKQVPVPLDPAPPPTRASQ